MSIVNIELYRWTMQQSFSIEHCLFQAKMWREHYTKYGDWERQIARVTREECLQRAQIAIRRAHQLNKR